MIIAPATTSVSIDIQIVDDTGLPVTGLVAATFPAISYSKGANAAAVSITLTDLALITTAHPNDNTAGGVKERAGGFYRLDLPNNAVSTACSLAIIGEASGKRVIAPRIEVEYVAGNLAQWLGSAPLALSSQQVQAVVPSTQKVDVETIKTQTVTCAAGVTVSPYVGSTGAAINGTNANTLSSHDPGATLGTSTLTQTQVTGGAYALNNSGFAFSATLDFTTAQKAATLARVTLVDTATNVGTLTTYTGNTPQTGDSFARIGAAGAGLTALGDTRIANLDAAVTTRMAAYTHPTGFLAADFSRLDVAVSTRMATFSYTAPDNAGIAAAAASAASADSKATTINNNVIAVGSAVTAIGSPMQAGPVTLAASQPNYAPAKAGDAMTLTGAYDAAKTAATQTSVNNVAAVTAKLETMLEAAGEGFQFTEVALENAPTGDAGDLTDVDNKLDTLLARTAARVVSLTWSAVTDAGQTLQIIAGDSYLATDNSALAWAITSTEQLPNPLPGGTTVALKLKAKKDGTVYKFAGVIDDGADKAITVDVTAAQSLLLVPGDATYHFALEFKLADDDARVFTAIRGAVNVKARIADPA